MTIGLRTLIFLWWLTALSSALPGQEGVASISGKALRVEGGSPHPLSNVEITLRSVTDQGLLGATVTDSDGAFAFQIVPPETVRITASRPGYLVAEAGSRPATEIVLACPNAGVYPQNDFLMVRGASIDGRVVDQYGEPAQGVTVVARRKDMEEADASSSAAETDDRGFFRIAGLPAGIYELAMQLGPTTRGYEPQARTFALAAGEAIGDATLLLRHLARYPVSGRVGGLPSGSAGEVSLTVERLPRPGPRFRARTTPDGRFDFRLVPEGRYAVFAQAGRSAQSRPSDLFLNVIEVRNDMTDLVLSPVALGSLEGRVRWTSGDDLGSFQLALVSEDGLDTFRFRVDRPDFRFSQRDVKPGRYRIETRSPRLYVKRVGSGSGASASKSIDVREGAVTRIDIEAGADFARIHGTLRSAQARTPPPAGRIAMMSGGEQRFVIADGEGRFTIPKIVPGEYRICAWQRIPIDRIFDQDAWQKAGCMSRTFNVEPQADIELSLTAVEP